MGDAVVAGMERDDSTSRHPDLMQRARGVVHDPVSICGRDPAAACKARAKLRALLPATDDDTAHAACPGTPHSVAPRARRLPWADLLRRVFAEDVLVCPPGAEPELAPERYWRNKPQPVLHVPGKVTSKGNEITIDTSPDEDQN